MAARDGIGPEEVGSLLFVGGLAVGHLATTGIEGIDPDEVGGLGDVLLDHPLKGARRRVGPHHHEEGAGLILLEVIHSLPPPSVLQAHWGVARHNLHGLVCRLHPCGVGTVQVPPHPPSSTAVIYSGNT